MKLATPSERETIEVPLETELLNPDLNHEEYINNEIEKRTEKARRDYEFWHGIGPEGLEIISDPEGSDGEDGKNERIANWWNTLGNATKREVYQRYFNQDIVNFSGLGKALNTWLHMNRTSLF